jgi:hypothetical protein
MTTPENILFTKVDMESHILRMCLLHCQDQYNLHKRGMTLLDMCSLLTSLEAIACICTQEKANAQSSKKASSKDEKSNKQPGTELTTRVLKMACTEKHCNLCKKHGGTHIMHNTSDCHKYEMDRKEKGLTICTLPEMYDTN